MFGKILGPISDFIKPEDYFRDLEIYDQELEKYDVTEIEIEGSTFDSPKLMGMGIDPTFDRKSFKISVTAKTTEEEELRYSETLGPELFQNVDVLIEQGRERMDGIREELEGHTDEMSVEDQSLLT
jgi:hypothetical protein